MNSANSYFTEMPQKIIWFKKLGKRRNIILFSLKTQIKIYLHAINYFMLFKLIEMHLNDCIWVIKMQNLRNLTLTFKFLNVLILLVVWTCLEREFQILAQGGYINNRGIPRTWNVLVLWTHTWSQLEKVDVIATKINLLTLTHYTWYGSFQYPQIQKPCFALILHAVALLVSCDAFYQPYSRLGFME